MSKKAITAEDFKEEVAQLYGRIVIVEDEEGDEVSVIPTGSLSLDISLGIGGIPLRRYTEIYGPEGSGKTSLALSICKNCITDGGKVLYIDTEQGVDYTYARTLVGSDLLNPDSFILIQPETAEQALTIAEKAIKSEQFRLIILDSVGALAPEKEKKDSLTDSNVALVARLLTTFLRRTAFDIREQDVGFIFINQVRDKIGSFFSTYETPGGRQLKHLLSVRIQMSQGTKIKEGEEIVGILSTFVIKKNKLAPPFRSSIIPIYFGKGVENYQNIFEFAYSLNIIKKAGSYYKFENETIGQGRNNVVEVLRNNKELLDKIVNACYNEVKGVEIIEERSDVKEDEQIGVN